MEGREKVVDDEDRELLMKRVKTTEGDTKNEGSRQI